MVDSDEIKHLIELKQEGPYWDFKRQWYECNVDLLKDIICFANNLVNKDCYIIIGVDEERDYAINDVTNDSNRKNTQKIVDFLKAKQFAGDVRPEVTVESIYINDKCLDVIIIHNSANTPFYTIKDYIEDKVHKSNKIDKNDKSNKSKVLSFHIYTRIWDTNTSSDSSADINKAEYLWRKRFGLDVTPFEKLTNYLSHYEDWDASPNNEEELYYKYFPEYRLVLTPDERKGYEVFHFTQSDIEPLWGTISFYYHQTMLASCNCVYMDGARWCCMAPDSDPCFVKEIKDLEYTCCYFYTKGTFEYLVNEFVLKMNRGSEYYYDYKKFLSVILVFENENERKNFKQYISDNLNIFEKLYNKQKIPPLQQISNYRMEYFEKEFRAALVLQTMLYDFRQNNINAREKQSSQGV